MAANPGEDIAATLFADVHYFYGSPTAKPPHHRFEKGSYVYLFENASQRKARIEVANNAGTPDQEAFSGYLDSTHVHYSYKHTTLVTLTVESANGHRTAPLESPEWHLPTFDPRNENKYTYKLHTLDIYFWAKEDAVMFVNGVRRVLPPQQVTVLDEPVPPAPHHDPMSPVVQKLENVAISDSSYHNGQTRDSRQHATSFPGPPISATPQSQETSNFAPLAYNPAAPAAPETIKHREKTPPPEDGAGNPLMAAAAADQGQMYGHQSLPGPPSQAPSQSNYQPAGLPSAPMSQPPPSAGLQSPYAQHFQNQFAPPPTAPTVSSPYAQSPASSHATPSQGTPAYHNSPQQHIPVTQFASYPNSTSPSSGVASPGIYSPGPISPQQNPGIYSPSQPSMGPPTQAPPGGFSQYQYGNSQAGNTPMSHTQAHSTDHSVHQQVYRPTEGEAPIKHNEKPVGPPKKTPGKFEQRAGQLEKGVGGFLKKLEKKYG